MIQWLWENLNSLVVILLVLEGFVFNRVQARFVRQRIAAERELCDAWIVLTECTKILSTREDFDSRHVHKLIYDLALKYQPDGHRVFMRNEAPPTKE